MQSFTQLTKFSAVKFSGVDKTDVEKAKTKIGPTSLPTVHLEHLEKNTLYITVKNVKKNSENSGRETKFFVGVALLCHKYYLFMNHQNIKASA